MSIQPITSIPSTPARLAKRRLLGTAFTTAAHRAAVERVGRLSARQGWRFPMIGGPHLIKRHVLSFAVIASLALGAGAVPVAAAGSSAVPFSATITEHFTVDPTCFPTRLCAAITGSGQAAHLGNIVESATIISYLSKPLGAGCFPESRTTTLTAANGDQITLAATGKNCATSKTILTGVDSYTVTGGTGRFGGASGSGTVSASVNQANATAEVTLTGTLSAPGSQAQLPAGMPAAGQGGAAMPGRGGLAILIALLAGLVTPRLLLRQR